MIHQIKALYDKGDGLSIRAIARKLEISRNTVRKYLSMNESEISERMENRERVKRLDEYREYIVHLLQSFPKLSAVKISRKLKDAYPDMAVSNRSVRRYVERLRETVNEARPRYYCPVKDLPPGLQLQVDGGELRGVSIGGVETTVYFVVFVLSCSRLIYVALSSRPVDTGCFIRMHDAAFRYFGGCPEECVYDQTKLVVLEEKYRELKLNPRFNEYATYAGFRIHACEGYDPESKGKVEAGVKYVKNNCLYGEMFADWTALETHVSNWLEEVANVRDHAVTKRQPREHFEVEERSKLRLYNTPRILSDEVTAGSMETRKADKTGLISWKANKYSVPHSWQCSTVGVQSDDQYIYVHDIETKEEIARHELCYDKGKLIRNTHHYRDMSVMIREHEGKIETLIGKDRAAALCELLKKSAPKYYKDQLTGAFKILQKHAVVLRAQAQISEDLWYRLLRRNRLTACGLEEMLEAYVRHPDRLADVSVPTRKNTSELLVRYGDLIGREISHELH